MKPIIQGPLDALGSRLKALEEVVAAIQAKSSVTAIFDDTAGAPRTGSYRRGDVVISVRLEFALFAVWVCTASGSPGTWQVIDPI